MCKRIIPLLMALIMLLSLCPLQVLAAEVDGLQGDGTKASPYEIHTADELVFAAGQMNENNETYTGKYYILREDVDMASVESFPMIDSFTGDFDGNGKTIKNMTIVDKSGYTVEGNGTDLGKAGYGVAFVHKNSGSIHDVTFEEASVSTNANGSANGYSGAAVVAVENLNGSVIDRVTVKDSIVNAPKMTKVAGIVAMNMRDPSTKVSGGTVVNCSVNGCNLTGGPRAANNGTGLILGGIAAYNATSTIQNCYVKNVTMTAAAYTQGSAFNAGIICGYISGGQMSGNVAASGVVAYAEGVSASNFGKVCIGSIAPRQNADYTLAADKNLEASSGVPEKANCAVSGQAASADDLAEQATYQIGRAHV